MVLLIEAVLENRNMWVIYRRHELEKRKVQPRLEPLVTMDAPRLTAVNQLEIPP